jgi:hypothetical protein
MNERIKQLAKQSGLNDVLTGSVDEWDVVELEKFVQLLLADYATKLVEANMRSPEYERAMDAHYEQKWAHRFD